MAPTWAHCESDGLLGDHVSGEVVAHVTGVVVSRITGDHVGKVEVAVQTRGDAITFGEVLDVCREKGRESGRRGRERGRERGKERERGWGRYQYQVPVSDSSN